MDNTVFYSETPQAPLSLNEQSETLLVTTARWSKFLAIITFVIMGIMFISGLLITIFSSVLSEYQDFAGVALLPMGITYTVLPVIYLFPGLYLYRYAAKMNEALFTRDEASLTTAFLQHKKLFKFFGVLSIIGIAFMLLFIIIGAVAGFTMAAF